MKLQPILCALALLLSYNAATAQQHNKVKQRIILIGDAGEVHEDVNPVIDAIKRTFDMNDTTNTVLFLGDNVYPRGVPDSFSRKYPKAKEILDYQVSLLKGGKAKGIFVPGNHDWNKSKPGGWDQIRRQQQYVDSLHLPNVEFQPKDGCPGPVAYMIGDDILLIVMDTEWWLFPYDKPDRTSGCDCKTPEDVILSVSEMAARYPHKMVVFAAHHPFRSYGPHGGYYTLKQHIFPLTDLKPWLYLPLPVIGSVYPVTRGVFGTKEDIPHPLYQKLIKGVENALPKDVPTVFVAGHEHTLQYIEDAGRHYIVSGSGAKDTRVKQGKKSQFASKVHGFTALEQLEDGSVRVRYFNAGQDTVMFAKQMFQLPDHIPVRSSLASRKIEGDSLTIAADTQYLPISNFHRWLLGENYRREWAQPLKIPIFDLHKRDFSIIKRGGGQQTRSLRLENNKTGDEYVLRSMQKDPTAAIPAELRETFAKDVVQDQISAANPYAPLVVAQLAEVAGVPHTNPSFVYLPKDTALGVYQQFFGDQMYLFEEREPVKYGKTYNTEKMLDNYLGDNDNSIDQHATLQARLFDMYISDWDRHDDQWRWYDVKNKKEKTRTFYPVPRDRDQAFFINEGFIPRAAARRWLLPNIQGFRKYFVDIIGFNNNAKYFDRSFLNSLDEQTWKTKSHDFLLTMTDTAIDNAVKHLPEPIQKIDNGRIAETLKARRSTYESTMMKYYRFLAKQVDVTGTAKNELFVIEKLGDGKVGVNSYKISKKGEVQQNLYSRVFDAKHTKEIRIYGLGGEDVYTMKGDHRLPIQIRVIGGAGKDTYIDSSTIHRGKKIKIYDLKSPADSFAINNNEKLFRSNKADIIAYDRKAFQYDKIMPLAAAGYNLDDGLSLGLGIQITKQGFRKSPFKVKHTLTATHALATKAYNFRYEGIFTDLIGKNDLEIMARARAPHNTINFFGFGNETEYNKEISDPAIRYYRARFNIYTFQALLRHDFGPKFNLAFGPTFENYALDKDENDDRFVTNFSQNGLDSTSIFRDKYYAGGRLVATVDTRNNPILPSRGVIWSTSLQGNLGLNHNSRDLLQLKSDMSIYMSFSDPASVVLVARFGGGTTWGNPEFFQAMSLGGNTNLRGYRNYRFAGESMVYNNMEVRAKLFDFATYIIPGSVGIIAFNDVGRVWQPGEKSGVWHDGYGGGIYVTPVNLFVLTAVLGHSKEGTLPYITFGFKF
ncbi:outer membrane protein assembly factor BamA [Chitinophaga skermanii]|uniref:Outer membrane protein assembly factor BamA n=1 Tax=Chitinophaga skermanii TaxID=331697 RepID=A0A327QI84_9BACT|nr:BamA/TamA family outer membrane protein [Chitinophaga skermanii]RAJ04279.1 outer membrane protein assembly factor BamA [Chitinophaga skermanii]